ncbi:MAG: four helix bundle protein [bacterium]|nr:four helix bundle protein [bacterium]
MKETYRHWYAFYHALPKLHRYSLGIKVDTIFVDTIEAVAWASFLPRDEKVPVVRLATRKVDTLKILLMVLWENKSLEDKKFIALSAELEEIGRMLGGWLGQLKKQNSPAK